MMSLFCEATLIGKRYIGKGVALWPGPTGVKSDNIFLPGWVRIAR